VQIAEGFARRIKARCDRIGYAPLGGRPRDDLAQGLRTVPFEKSVVITYVIVSDSVEITNIFYGGRDYQMFYRGHQSTDPDA
jgi:toxin ParE1/3/4